MDILFPHDKSLHGKIPSMYPPALQSLPPNQKNPPESVCTLPSNLYCM